MTTSLWLMARFTDSVICSRWSPTDVRSQTTMPALFRWRAIDAELVSTICPIRISSPIVRIDAFMVVRLNYFPGAGEAEASDAASSIRARQISLTREGPS